ncbi:aldehyde dehydrogenase family protein [Ureibacillus terrenus]|uniref:3-sulfolactaldehyde dehydrogenase n=1 Tax=Ureibacillus terrenus TaxID=118246 RepID=A0A540V3N3_9BACL|nr:aldehyde dehydrogenase family protein [Ureibacillus terrenus]MED3763167.1 aldehyde dehydrogenase family protein [Ureibacillus terrenus]TQE91328.1 aldehyde dehydrogenase family protein [Ureibacillus terrenus]
MTITVQNFTRQYINGQWREGGSSGIIKNINPYTGEELLTIKGANHADLDDAYSAAQKAQPIWESMPLIEKKRLFERLIDVLQEKREEIIQWLIQESGSTLLKATSEFESSLRMVKESASFLTRIKGEILPSHIPNKENRVYRTAKGVIGVIGPWNFPFLLTMRSVAPAIAVGNSVVIKPASDTPVTSGLMFGVIFEQAGFPEGLVNVIVGRGSEVGDAFVSHPIPSMISFTGSTEVGRRVGELAGKYLKDVALELGGNNAMIVLDDANIEKAAKAAAFGKFMHQGQICMALNRIIVDESVHDEFVEKFVDIVKKLRAGNPVEKTTFIGPLINQQQIERIQKDVRDSVAQGAMIVLDGPVKNLVMSPIVLTNVTNDMPIAKNEIFGPVACIIKAKDEEDAIRIANDTPYGLSGSVFTADIHRGVEVGKKMKTGMVHINDQSVNDEAHVAFGGEKDSGIGRFNGEWAIDKFTTTKWIGVQSGYREYPI